MSKTVLAVSLLWTVLVGGSFSWNYSEASSVRDRIALETARSFFDQIVLTRRWNAEHGGVYVPVTEKTRPNEYLQDPRRDFALGEGFTLTKVNPAFMTRQISEIAAEQRGLRFHITSLKPLRPGNEPTPQEEKALKAFEAGTKEVGYFARSNDEDDYFYMAPLKTDASCLACHAAQGYREGDVRGGISITLPFLEEMPLPTLAAGHLALWLPGFAAILFFGHRLERYYALLREQSVMDALTGIANRRSFSETLLRELRAAQRDHHPLALILCDIDFFKGYNDTYGHDAGDHCLRKVAQTIQSTLLRPSDFCARYGGEEFVIILPNTNREGAYGKAEQIRKQVHALGLIHEKSPPEYVVTISMGVATMPEGDMLSDEALVHAADEALYRAKAGGRNRVEMADIPGSDPGGASAENASSLLS